LRSLLPSDENNMQLSEHFELAEFLVSETAARRGIANEPTPEIIENLRRLCQLVLEPLRVKLARPVVITSGYRSPALNRAIGGSPTSHHMQGRAADLIVPGMTPLAVCQAANQLKLPCVQIIHEFGRWAHLSVAATNERTQLLTAKLAQGKTVYQPGLVHV
jgi:zinc D-Ala-D-Ala carboxypeptidase